MKKGIFISILIVIFTMSANASTMWDLQGSKYAVDTIYHAVIGPGTTQTTITLKGTVNLKVFYTTTDLKNPNVNLRVIMGKNNLLSTITVPNMPDSHNDETNIFFAGVNADFFSYSTGPTGTTVSNGIMYKSYKGTGWYAFGVDKNKKLYSGSPYTTFKLLSPNAGQGSVKAVNNARASNEMIIYTSARGATSGTNSSGTEVGAQPVNGGLKSNGTTTMRLTEGAVSGKGSMTIPEGGFVLSGNGYTENTIAKMREGEEFSITPTIYFNDIEVPDIVEMAGGCPMLLQKGAILNTQGLLDHLSTRQPRTAVGYNVDGDKLIMLVVDGRQAGISVGVTSKDLAAIMKNVGCSEALNFDGGGSSTLYVKELGVRNIPSDGSNRAVKNGLFLSTPKTSDTKIATIRFVDWSKIARQGSYYTPQFYGYNAQGVLVDTNLTGVQLSCSALLGSVQPDGAKVLFDGWGTHTLTATYGTCTATLVVTVNATGAVDNIIEDSILKFYPNIIQEGETAFANISINTDLYIYNIAGQIIKTAKLRAGVSPISLPVDDMSKGIYLLNFKSIKENKTQKLIIK
ncbi:MAG: phosphodiester glycosidase family protein [Muribaculaceae bacterium]|nr:phosphodiester glycosidase family protein [Muribaculaceae bacterium]